MPKDLTSESLTKLLATLSPDEAESVVVYTELHESLIRYFETKGISAPDKAADETLDRIADKIQQDRQIADLFKYAFGVAKFIYLEKLRREEIESRAADEFYVKSGASKPFDAPDEFELLRECFGSLYEHERELLLSYFADLPPDRLAEYRQKLANREGLELNTLRNRVSRLRKRLEDCLDKKK